MVTLFLLLLRYVMGFWVVWLTRIVLQRFQESLVQDAQRSEEERDQYFGLSLRELVHTYKWQSLVLFKCLLLQPKVSTPTDIGWEQVGG